jgi:hypothetical protein
MRVLDLRARRGLGDGGASVWGPKLGTSALCTQWSRSVGVGEEHANGETAFFNGSTKRRSGVWKG